jgi:competence protein ComGE
MLLKNKGFFLIDLLLSLSALLMLSLFFIPSLIDLKNQAWRLEIENQSYQILYEELQILSINGQVSSLNPILKNGIAYQISLKDADTFGQKEVCVKVENNSFYGEEEVCGLSE